jgi:hypothetical protein
VKIPVGKPADHSDVARSERFASLRHITLPLCASSR